MEYIFNPDGDYTKDIHKLNAYVADLLTIHKISLDNVFFFNTPNFVAFFSQQDDSIMHIPASELTNLVTRKVLFEKCKHKRKFSLMSDGNNRNGDAIVTKTVSSSLYKFGYYQDSYNKDNFALLKKFLENRRHLAFFMYIGEDFMQNIDKGLVRVYIN